MARDNVYKCNDDKEKYLDILCKASKIYKVNVHDYCLIDNYYHLPYLINYHILTNFLIKYDNCKLYGLREVK